METHIRRLASELEQQLGALRCSKASATDRRGHAVTHDAAVRGSVPASGIASGAWNATARADNGQSVAIDVESNIVRKPFAGGIAAKRMCYGKPVASAAHFTSKHTT